jgi:hypothetical protein
MGSGGIMANGMNPPQQQQPMQEDITPEEQKELTQYFEDMMVNDWIKNEKGLDFSANEGDTKYDALNRDSKDRMNHDIFNYYNDKYTKSIVENEHSPNITFENFVLMHNPEGEFKVDLLNFSLGSKKTDATVWQDSFNTNTELHKKAALEGYKYNLMMMGAAQGDVQSQST